MAAQCWSTCEEISHVQGQRRSPSKMVGGAKSHLESNPLPARDAQRAQTDLVCTKTQRPHRDWDRTVFGCLLRRYRSAVDCYSDRVSGCSRPGCGVSPFGGGCYLLTIDLPDLTHDWGNRLWGWGWGGTNGTLCSRRPRRKKQWPHKRLTQIYPWVSRSLWWGVGRWWPVAGLGTLSIAVHAWDLLKEVPITFITSTIVLPQVK